MLSRVLTSQSLRVAGVRNFRTAVKLMAPPPHGGPKGKPGKKKLHIVPEFKEDDLDWKEVPKVRAQEEHWARERERDIIERLIEEGKVAPVQQKAPEKHFYVKIGNKDPQLIGATDFADFQNQIKQLTGGESKSVKTTVKVENDEYKMDFDEKLFNKFNDKLVIVE